MLQTQESVGVLISAARRRLREAVTARARHHGLSAQEFWVLVAAREMPDTSLGALADRQQLALPTASRVVAALAKRGLLRIVAAEDDRRRARISLTAKGEALTRELQRTAAEVRAALVDGLGRDEEAALRQALKKVTGNLERYIARSGRRT